MNKLVCLAVFFSLGACAGLKIPPIDAKYGQPPVAYEKTVEDYFSKKFSESESPTYRFLRLGRAFINEGTAFGGDVSWLGYYLEIGINTKNQSGEYTGDTLYTVLFNESQIHKAYKGDGSLWVLLTRVDSTPLE